MSLRSSRTLVRTAGAPVRVIAAGLLAALALFLVPAAWSPAQAHDQLLTSNPEDGAELQAQPQWIELAFSGNLEEVGSEIQVTHVGEDRDYSAGEIAVEGRTLTSALPEGIPAGEYTVTWRVVSEDGHPISGTFGFTLLDDGSTGGSASGTPAAEETEGTASEDGLSAGVVDSPVEGEGTERGELDESAATGGGMSTPMIVLLSIGGLAVVALVITLLVRKARFSGTD
ncbi:copper resistance CopC family protein [Brevibacterium samyangense]|uniref:Copper resistance protein CopC n=1 Tax=Brevibacterium samyangense TaxID=366888 RepID=A0ABN2TFV7_9MICO